MPIFCQKNVNSVKITHYDQKSEEDVLFFGYFTKKALMYIYFQKRTSILSKDTALMPIFCRKNVHFFKNTVLLCQFFQNFHRKPLAVMPIFDQKHQFYQNYTILWAKKVNRMPFFSDFSRKNHRSHAHIL